MSHTFRILVCGFVLFLAVSVDASPPTSAPTTIIEGWQELYDSTNGASWTKCSGNRDTPCTCTESDAFGSRTGTTPFANVNCDGNGLITGYRLVNNGLTGSVTASSITKMFDAGGTFHDLRENTFDSGSCADIPRCTSSNCLGFNFCTSAPTNFPTKSPSTQAPSVVPTSVPTTPLNHAWYLLYDQLGGASWTKCSDSREDPCSCVEANNFASRSPSTAPYAAVNCDSGAITGFRLVNNNVAGTLTDAIINALVRLKSNVFCDFRENTATLNTTQCITTEVEFTGTALGFSLCTPSPTQTPTTGTPTTATPSVFPSVSPTAMPTLSVTSSPSLSPSATPSSIPTGAPSNTPSESPSEIPTYAPSAEPTYTPTGAPSYVPTQTPTSPTQSPTDSPIGFTPTDKPSEAPSTSPSMFPTPKLETDTPTNGPTEVAGPTGSPVNTLAPTRGANRPDEPTISPTENSASVHSVSVFLVGIIVAAVGWQMREDCVA